MGEMILDQTLNQCQTIGAAVNAAKQAQNSSSSMNNWAILGDPSALLTTQ